MNRIHWTRWLLRLGGWLLVLGLAAGTAQAGLVDHFTIQINASLVAGQPMAITLTAYDASGNSCLASGEVADGVALTVSSGVGFDSSSYSPNNIPGSQFEGDGTWTGLLTLYRSATNISLTATSGAASGLSSPLNVTVNPNSDFYRYIVILPGQTYTPGENHSGWGRSGTASAVTAGNAVAVQVVATDLYGNPLTSGPYASVTANLSLERTDAMATLPAAVGLLNGVAAYAMTLTTAYDSPTQQRLAVSGGVPHSGTSDYFTVQASGLHHFAVSSPGTTLTAGTAFSTVIAAQDAYYNPVTSFAGPIYVTCPTLDYHRPEQSVINVAGGTMTGVTWTVAAGFANGQWSGNLTVFRAGNPATLFAASQPDGTGITGASAVFAVEPNTLSKLFLIVPGLEYRPGTAGGLGNSLGGYFGTPDAQQAGTPFSVTVYATDAWWNRVNSSGAFHTSTLPGTSSVNGAAWNFTQGTAVLAISLNSADTYQITADYDTSGVADYTCPYVITTTLIDHFTITGPGGSALPSSLIAGVPLTVSITAFANAAETLVTTTFNGQANLATSADYAEPFRVISPGRITFTQGFWTGPVTVYRACETITLQCQLGQVSSIVSSTPTVYPNIRQQLLALAPGMLAMPGLAPDNYPPGGFPGYTGNPEIQEAGQALDISFFLTDAYYNVVTASAQGGLHHIRISSSDPYPARLDNVDLPVTMVLGPSSPQPTGYAYGAYRSNTFKLYTVGSNGYQTVTVEDLDDSNVRSFTLGGNHVPPIPVKHTGLARLPRPAFQVSIDPSAKTAGVAFPITLTALDEYGNVMDNRNGATAFAPGNNVALSSGSVTRTLSPVIASVPYNGVAYLSLTCYKTAEGVGNSVVASLIDSDGEHAGSSAVFDVRPNEFARLIPIVPGLDLDGGRYTAEPPTEFIGFSGSPDAQTAGQAITLRVYACDAYGNLTPGATDSIRLSSSDPFAPNPAPKPMDANLGYATFDSFAFHRAAMAQLTAHNHDNPLITDGTTPNISVNAALAYGLVTVAPGQVLLEGSGNSNMASGINGVVSGGWYSGVTLSEPPATGINALTADPELAGHWFNVTVVATDVFGNRRYDVTDQFEVRTTNENDSEARPNVAAPIPSAPFETPPYTLVSGMAWAYVKLLTLSSRLTIYPWNLSNSLLNHQQESYSDIPIVSFTSLYFKVWVNGKEAPEPVTVQAAPSTFTVTIEVRENLHHKILRTANIDFILEVVTHPATAEPGHGVLSVTSGQTIGGVATISQQSYSQAETIYLRVKAASNTGQPAMGYSPSILVTGAPATATATPAVAFQAGINELKAVNNRYFPGTSRQPVLLQFNQQTPGPVTVRIYSSRGNPICTLVNNQALTAGAHTWEWRAQNDTGAIVPSGIYIVHLTAPGVSHDARVAVIK